MPPRMAARETSVVVTTEECRHYDVHVSLGPGINIKRNPLCGRNFEYFSEGPLLAAEMGVSQVDGVQSKGVGVSVKHFALNNTEHCPRRRWISPWSGSCGWLISM